jgi:competence protein CoiA
MQIYALNSKNERIFVESAQKSEDYFCLECKEKVRVRGGPHKQLHFYHVLPKGECRQSGKSIEHLLIQNLISSQIKESELEVSFPHVNRIADVVWKERKIVFEVQCSPISAEEVSARNRDYESQGFQVIWILYDKTFGKRRASAAEAFLVNETHYFSDTTTIYDQAVLFIRGFRHSFEQNGRKIRRSIQISQLHVVNKEKFLVNKDKAAIPEFLLKRLNTWGYFTEGDLLDEIHSGKFDLLKLICEQERCLLPKRSKKTYLQILQSYFFKALSALHTYLIEKTAG